MPGLVASLGSWGVRAGHWLPDRGGVPALWLTTQTDRCAVHRVGDDFAAKGQVAILPTRAEISSEGMKRLSVLVDSEKGQERLLRDAT